MTDLDLFSDNSPIVAVDDSGVPTTTSLRIADGTQVQHKNVLDLIRGNLTDFEEFGLLAFQTRARSEGQHGGGDVTYAVLNEEHATLALTYMRNTDIVRDFKKRLVREFYTMRQLLQRPALQGSELMAAGYAEAMKTLEQRESRIQQLEQKSATDAPKVTYVDTYVTDADLLSFSTVASTNGVKESWLRELLLAKDWIYVQSESRWSNRDDKKIVRNRYTEKADKKRYFRRLEVHEAPRFHGEVMHTLKITPAGAEAIARLIAREMAA